MSIEVNRDISHIIWDLDGLLIDTETCYTKATNSITQRFGKQFTWDLKSKVMGLSPIQSSQTVINELDIPLNVNQYLELMNEEFSIAIKEVELMAGAERLVKHFHSHRIPMAIATGSNTQSFATKIQKFDHFFTKSNYFSHYVLAADDIEVKRGKPFPDSFLICMKRFDSNLKPENVLVFNFLTNYFNLFYIQII
jgi:pseudouridine-5'-monophosphatase